MPTEPIHRIKRIRLINFHNFTDELLEVRNGGHLFLLGDNGSGKTTLLDAVHLALTAGENLEFNAAARVAGSSRDGRRLQGIILRQNIESPVPLNPNGGITYVALEIEGRQSKPVCFLLGMEAHAVDDQVRYWGAVRSCAIEELPLLTEQDGNRYPISRRELRDRLGDSTFCPDLKSYRQQLIRRLYGGRDDLFEENCRLLRMSKAYREIAAGTSDYHELFKKLLRHPKRDLFDRVVRTLRELDQSRTDLDQLEARQRYVEGLNETVLDIARLREAALRYRWLTHHLRRARLEHDISLSERDAGALEGEIARCAAEIDREEGARLELQRQLGVLQQADPSGLLTFQKERTDELARLDAQRRRHEDEAKLSDKDRSSAGRASRDADKEWHDSLARLYTALHGLRTDIPFPISDVLTDLDALQRVTDVREAHDVATDTASAEAQRAWAVLASEVAASKAKLDDGRSRLARIDGDLAALSAQEEIAPSIPGFREALLSIERRMIDVRPLYRGLEWKPGLSSETKSAIEEAIGPEILGILLIPSSEYDVSAQIVFADYPGLRIANRDEARDDPPAWVRESFDLSASDPASIRVLSEEMTAGRHPAVRRFDGAPILGFRSHERRLHDSPATLIGAERRREALRRQVKALSDERAGVQREVRALEKDLAALAARENALDTLSTALRTGRVGTSEKRHLALAARDRLTHAEERSSAVSAAMEESTERWQACRDQLADLQARISNEGLDKLEDKQRKAERDRERTESRIADLLKQHGAIGQQMTACRNRREALRADLSSEAEAAQAIEKLLQPFAQGVESVEYYVLRTWRGQQFESVENVQAELDRVGRDEAEKIGTLRERLGHPTYGASHGFAYDAASNHLADRHMSPIREVVIAGQRRIDEQREVINERTRELIRNIIMGDLFAELKADVHKLRDMVRKINYQLGGRVFGSNRYRFRLEEEKRYRELLKVVEHYNPFDPAAQEELERFLELYKDEIMSTEVNEIPEALDYRNWFRYELAMSPSSDDAEVVMSRRTKSLGSGGEQAVPNYLLILTVAHFLYDGNDALRTRTLLFDEAFYGIDSGRRDQLLGFASDIGLQLLVASPDLDGVKHEVPYSTTVLVVKDDQCDVHLFACDFANPSQLSLLDGIPDVAAAEFGSELGVTDARE